MNPDQYRVRVCAAILRPGDEMLVVRESRRGVPHIALPGGMPELGETLERAVIREVREETGYEIVPGEIAFVAEERPDRWDASTLQICFYASVTKKGERPERAGENILDVEWRRLDEEAILRAIPQAQLFASSRRGRYLDVTMRERKKRASS